MLMSERECLLASILCIIIVWCNPRLCNDMAGLLVQTVFAKEIAEASFLVVPSLDWYVHCSSENKAHCMMAVKRIVPALMDMNA